MISPLRWACALATALLLLTACGERVEQVETTEIEKTMDPSTEAGLLHVVHFWLTEDLTAEQTEAFERGVRSLEEIPTVRRMVVGPAAATPSRGVVDNSFDYALIVWFDDVAGHDTYQDHPIHTKFVADHEAKFARVVVRDNVLE